MLNKQRNLTAPFRNIKFNKTFEIQPKSSIWKSRCQFDVIFSSIMRDMNFICIYRNMDISSSFASGLPCANTAVCSCMLFCLLIGFSLYQCLRGNKAVLINHYIHYSHHDISGYRLIITMILSLLRMILISDVIQIVQAIRGYAIRLSSSVMGTIVDISVSFHLPCF